jgi:hypothetical protein
MPEHLLISYPLNRFNMKKYFETFTLAFLVSAGTLAPAGLSAQQRAVKVQGHPHELLTRKAAEGTALETAVSAVTQDTVYIDPADVQCWIDEPRLDTATEIDSAYLMIKWTDGKAIDSLFVWGYRWNPYQVYYDPVTGERDSSFVQYHGIDMLRAVVNNDERLSVLLQYTGVSGHFVGGIGLNWYGKGAACYPVPVDFDIAGAQNEGYVDFSYFPPNKYCGEGQVTVPKNANNSVTYALSDYDSTRFLIHPFGAEYGYPAYDFDYWNLDSYLEEEQHWQAGYAKNGFWGYFRADNRRVPIPSADFENDPDAAEFGVTYEPLRNQQVHGFVFEPGFAVHQFDGAPRYMDCGCAPCPANVRGGEK